MSEDLDLRTARKLNFVFQAAVRKYPGRDRVRLVPRDDLPRVSPDVLCVRRQFEIVSANQEISDEIGQIFVKGVEHV